MLSSPVAGRLASCEQRLRTALADVPEERRGALQKTLDVVAVGDRLIPLAEIGVRANLERARLDLVRELGLLGRIRLGREREPHLLQLLVARPAEPGLLARRVEGGGADRVEHIRRDPRG